MQDAMKTDWTEVYRASRYAFARDGSWGVFALDGDGGPMADLETSVTLVSAWNPGSKEAPLEENQAANARLEAALAEAGAVFGPAWGASLPGIEPPWREDGFAVRGLSRERAAQLGLEWGQQAVVWLDAGATELLFCATGDTVSCGLRHFEEGDA